jgi:hypothetical protein
MLLASEAPADTSAMSDPDLDELRAELKRLEAAEALASAKRNRLHQQIDFGFATDEARAMERTVSAERLELHKRIDAVREQLGLHAGPAASGGEPADGNLLPL